MAHLLQVSVTSAVTPSSSASLLPPHASVVADASLSASAMESDYATRPTITAGPSRLSVHSPLSPPSSALTHLSPLSELHWPVIASDADPGLSNADRFPDPYI